MLSDDVQWFSVALRVLQSTWFESCTHFMYNIISRYGQACYQARCFVHILPEFHLVICNTSVKKRRCSAKIFDPENQPANPQHGPPKINGAIESGSILLLHLTSGALHPSSLHQTKTILNIFILHGYVGLIWSWSCSPENTTGEQLKPAKPAESEVLQPQQQP